MLSIRRGLRVKLINLTKIATSVRVLHQLKQIDGNLNQLATFNSAYIIVTQGIVKNLSEGSFKDPALVEAFCVRFASYYFEAINSLEIGDAKLATAWQIAVSPKSGRSSSVRLLLGANAHINHDLPLALFDVMDGQKPTKLIGDLIKIDRLLIQSGRQILDSYDESTQPTKFIKSQHWLYFRPVMFVIRYWRIRAVVNFGAIQRSGLSGGSYQQRSTRIARQLAWIGRRLG